MQTLKVLVTVVMLAIVSAFTIAILTQPDAPQELKRSYAGVTIGNEYQSTSTDSTWAGLKKAVVTNTSGVLGSVIVTGTSATVFEIKDATSTTDVSSTTLATFAASPGTGTYVFDTIFTRGLSINALGSFAGKYTVTFRSN
ncbi:MAG: hypothetical protein WC648_01200 [Candidatus Paceibacterota bacterium]|jgi:hypothetical protein